MILFYQAIITKPITVKNKINKKCYFIFQGVFFFLIFLDEDDVNELNGS